MLAVPWSAAWSYFAVRWHHASPDDPVVFFEELREQRLEIRKVEDFGDGPGFAQTALPPS